MTKTEEGGKRMLEIAEKTAKFNKQTAGVSKDHPNQGKN